MKEPAEGRAANVTWARHSHGHSSQQLQTLALGRHENGPINRQVLWGCRIKEERLSLGVNNPRVCPMSAEFLLLTLKRSLI